MFFLLSIPNRLPVFLQVAVSILRGDDVLTVNVILEAKD